MRIVESIQNNCSLFWSKCVLFFHLLSVLSTGAGKVDNGNVTCIVIIFQLLSFGAVASATKLPPPHRGGRPSPTLVTAYQKKSKLQGPIGAQTAPIHKEKSLSVVFCLEVVMNNLCGQEFLTGPFDECLTCEYLRNGCSGPRTNAMEFPRWIFWIKSVMKRFGISNRELAENTGLSKSTVDDILAGRRKDISRETCCIIENYVLGHGKWPCAKKSADGKDTVYEDRPETLEALRRATEALREKEEQIAKMRAEYEDDVREYKELIIHMRTQVNRKDEQLARKDDYIDRLAKKVGI